MTKTPEQMAAEWYWANLTEQAPVVMLTNPEKHPPCPRKAFIAGYQAARDEYKVAIDTYNDVAKQMLEEAVRIMSPKDQLAAADKVMNSSNNLNGWISVKERLPPDSAKVLLIAFGDISFGWIEQSPSDPTEYSLYFGYNYIDKGHHALTHWMPIPKKPKYMSDYVESEPPKEEK